MKKLFSLTVIVIAALGMKAQTAKDAFNATEVVWYGLDFTKAKFVGQFDQGFGAMPATGTDMRNKWIPQWNALIAKEPQNFKIKDAFRKDNVYYDLAPLNELNSKIDVDNCMSFNPGKIERADIDAMVKKYGTGDKKEGIGLTFIVENFNKNMEMADVYVTFFDIATKKVLFTEKMSGKTIGVGMRNYWAGAIKNILKQIDGGEYKAWKAKA
ncbi:MAG: hypothetical protein JWO44_526 [Bacteroidetes bacterium]|jgi:hypothetical protein|nr:hypothetical protein [Bacteroidota bacterium]